MRWQEYIERNPKVMVGKPVIKGTRITVELILERLGYGRVHANSAAHGAFGLLGLGRLEGELLQLDDVRVGIEIPPAASGEDAQHS